MGKTDVGINSNIEFIYDWSICLRDHYIYANRNGTYEKILKPQTIY